MRMSTRPRWPVIWITGASSGIGRGLALALAREGSTVAASARSQADLAQLCDDARDLPGEIVAFPLDVTDAGAVRRTVETIETELGSIDLAVLNAGIYVRNEPAVASINLFRMHLEVNVMGIVHGLEPILERFISRRRGHVAVVASIAGYRGLPRASAYGASKAALINLCEALKIELRGSGITISLVNPGFVKTPLTDKNDFPMPFLMSLDKATDVILSGIEKGRFEIAFPKRLAFLMKVGRVLPYTLYFWLARRATGF